MYVLTYLSYLVYTSPQYDPCSIIFCVGDTNLMIYYSNIIVFVLIFHKFTLRYR